MLTIAKPCRDSRKYQQHSKCARPHPSTVLPRKNRHWSGKIFHKTFSVWVWVWRWKGEKPKGALSCWRLNCVNKKNLLISFLLVSPDATGSRSIGVSRKIPSVEIQTFFLWRKCSENQLSFATLKHRKKTDAEEKVFQLKEEKFVCSCDKTRRWQARIFRKPLVSCL